jgi:copper chaperone CopZ
MMRYLAVLVVAAVAVVWGGDTKKVDLAVTGMHCGHCTEKVKAALTKVQDVQSVQVDLKKGAAEIELATNSSTTPHMLALAVADAGYGASYQERGETKTVNADKAHVEDEECMHKTGGSMDCEKMGKVDCCKGKSAKAGVIEKK